MTKLPTEFQDFIHLSRYARWNEQEGRRESWPETVDRYFAFFDKHIDANHPEGAALYRKHRKELREAVLNLEVMPSMRCLMTAGKALERDNTAGYNPVVGTTPVLTKEQGLVPIDSLENEQATVLNVNGDWTPASFRGYGEQDIYKVTARLNSNTVNEVECTANHRWVLEDGTVKATRTLSNGDKIPFVTVTRNVDETSIDYKLGVIHGLVYGDGTTTYSCERVKGYHIRLVSDAQELIKWFSGYPVAYPPSANGDPVIMMYDGFAKTHGLKNLPNAGETDDYLVGFIRGWMAADGSVTKSSQVSICMCAEGREWFLKYASRLGYVVQSEYKQSAETNFGKRRKDSWRLSLSRSSLDKDDFIIPRKRARFKPLESHYVVSGVETAGYKAQVYCAEVPETNTFVLDKGLVTGNCAYVAIDSPRVFSEIMYVLMCGTGVGFSVERQYINKLSEVPEELNECDYTIRVSDSKRGWAVAFGELVSLLYDGKVPNWDTARVRPAGARLKTFGGRASGPEPLEDLFNFTVETFKKAKGRKLNSVECHDLACKVGDVVVVGGVRRSALISLSNLTDERMRSAKSGMWWEENGQRALANNSVAYTEKPDMGIFMREWQSLYESKSGERGIFSRPASQKQAARNGRRNASYDFGTNPCSEIVLRNKQFCNLTEVVVRPNDTLQDLNRKVDLATILGTMQATLTNFPFLSKAWKINTEEERLLGVSLTGISDHDILSGKKSRKLTDENKLETIDLMLTEMKGVAIETNKKFSKAFGIPQSAAITCVKPSGTVSQLVNSGSGIHPRFSSYYIRTVRADKNDPLAKFLKDQGVPCEDDVTKPDHTYVFSFPVKSPKGAVLRDDMTAIEQLELWEKYQYYWCEHKPSITVYVKEHEWLEVGAWVYEHFDIISGVSFLPHTKHVYRQAPYQEITKEEYEQLEQEFPSSIEWERLKEYEVSDMTTGSQELACVAGACEI